MESSRLARRLAAVAGGVAIITMAGLTASCANQQQQAPPTTTTTTTTSATTTSTPAPTEKSLSPSGGNLFTPQVKAPPAPTEPPGVHHNN
jgi:hypothetical protein